MPFTRIIVRPGRSKEELATISETLHEALVDSFLVPPDDRFQVIEEVAEPNFIYDKTYLTSQRTDNYTLFQITAGKPRTTAMKKQFYRQLCQKLVERTSLSAGDIMVVVQYTAPEDWSFGHGHCCDLKNQVTVEV